MTDAVAMELRRMYGELLVGAEYWIREQGESRYLVGVGGQDEGGGGLSWGRTRGVG